MCLYFRAPCCSVMVDYVMHCTHTHTHNHLKTHTSHRVAVQRSGLIYSAESSPWSVMRASGIIKFGPAGSFRLVGWLTLSRWLAASMMTDWVCGGWPVSRLIDYTCMSAGRSGRQAGCLFCYFFTDWHGWKRWLISFWFVGSWLAGWLRRWLFAVYFNRPSIPFQLYCYTANTSHAHTRYRQRTFKGALQSAACVKCADGRSSLLFNYILFCQTCLT